MENPMETIDMDKAVAASVPESALQAALNAEWVGDPVSYYLSIGTDYGREVMESALIAALPLLVGSKADDDMHDESVRRDAERWRHLMRHRYVDDGSGCILIDSHRTLPWEVMNDATDAAIRTEKEAGSRE